MTWYSWCAWGMQVWTGLLPILDFLWPAAADHHRIAQAMVLALIPAGLLRIWEFCAMIVDLWERFRN